MPGLNIPLASYEVRWFLEGWAAEDGGLQPLHYWFHTVDPSGRRGGLPAPDWKEWRTDVYLILPGVSEMGLKWRERQLEIKGLAASHGLQAFSPSCRGHVDKWVKWSCGGLPEAYENIFQGDAGRELIRVPVQKKRVLRKLRVDPLTAEFEEVSAETSIDRGVNVELTNLLVNDGQHCSLGFEAFPDDSAMIADLTRVVGAFLAPLVGIDLAATNSRSYPAWLASLGP